MLLRLMWRLFTNAVSPLSWHIVGLLCPVLFEAITAMLFALPNELWAKIHIHWKDAFKSQQRIHHLSSSSAKSLLRIMSTIDLFPFSFGVLWKSSVFYIFICIHMFRTHGDYMRTVLFLILSLNIWAFISNGICPEYLPF